MLSAFTLAMAGIPLEDGIYRFSSGRTPGKALTVNAEGKLVVS